MRYLVLLAAICTMVGCGGDESTMEVFEKQPAEEAVAMAPPAPGTFLWYGFRKTASGHVDVEIVDSQPGVDFFGKYNVANGGIQGYRFDSKDQMLNSMKNTIAWKAGVEDFTSVIRTFIDLDDPIFPEYETPDPPVVVEPETIRIDANENDDGTSTDITKMQSYFRVLWLIQKDGKADTDIAKPVWYRYVRIVGSNDPNQENDAYYFVISKVNKLGNRNPNPTWQSPPGAGTLEATFNLIFTDFNTLKTNNPGQFPNGLRWVVVPENNPNKDHDLYPFND